MQVQTWMDEKEALKAAGVELPQYDVANVKAEGEKNPKWIHFGGGNLFRAFHAELAHELANIDELDAGLIVCDTHDDSVINNVYRPYDNNMLEVIMNADGTLQKKLLTIVSGAYYAVPGTEDYKAVANYFENPSLQFATVTITEKGYALKRPDGTYLPVVEEDFANGPEKAKHTMSIMTSLLWHRFKAGEYPIAMVSTDNFSQNGKRFQQSLLEVAEAWEQKGFVTGAFVKYLKDDKKVSFPWSMIDRITPNPAESVRKELEAEGFTGMDIVHTPKGTNIAPFANTETVHYLVVEDSFPNGRPALEKVGVMLTTRETVDKADRMKVTTCLNPLHTALAVSGCLLGYTRISAEMKDPDLVALIKHIGYGEGLPVVENPGILSPQTFIDELLEKRLPNPNIPDAPQRIACDTSQKVPIRFGETIRSYVAADDKDPKTLKFIPLVIAVWLRYLLGKDDKGVDFTISPDPLLPMLTEQLKSLALGVTDAATIHSAVQPILFNETIFGSNLYEVGLGEKVEAYLAELLEGPEAVRKTIHKYV